MNNKIQWGKRIQWRELTPPEPPLYTYFVTFKFTLALTSPINPEAITDLESFRPLQRHALTVARNTPAPSIFILAIQTPEGEKIYP